MMHDGRPGWAVLPPGVAALLACLAMVGCSSEQEPIPAQAGVGFDFLTEAYSFENFARNAQGAALRADDVARMFGAERVCENRELPCRLTPIAQSWLGSVNQTLYEGRSEGFAVSALLFSLGELDPTDFGADSVAELTIAGNEALQAELSYWAATQSVPSAVADDVRLSARDVMPFLAKVMRPEHPERYRLAIAQKTDSGFVRGHAMVPTGYFRAQNGAYYLRVYDNNFPQRERLLEIDREAGVWRYEVPLPNGETLVYEGTPENGNLLYFSPVTTRLGTLKAPFAEDSTTSTLASSGGLQLSASSGEGNSAGIENGRIVESGSGRVVPAFSNCPLCNPARGILNYTLGTELTQEVSVLVSAGVAMGSEMSEEGAQVSIAAPGITATVSGIKGDSSEFDEIKVDPAGTVTYKPAVDRAVQIDTAIERDGQRSTVSVSLDGTASQVKVGLDSEGRPVVEHMGVPEGTRITVRISTVNAEGVQTDREVTFDADGENGELRYEPDTGVITTMSIRGPDEGSCYNGQLEPEFEIDADCGNTCSKRCELGQMCKEDGDCVGEAKCLGNVLERTCRMPGCTDRVLSPGETDVDCGGPTCDPCESNSAGSLDCLENRDCDNGLCARVINAFELRADGRLGCQSRSPVRVKIDGADPGSSMVFATVADGVSEQKRVFMDRAEAFTAKLIDAYEYEVSIAQQPEGAACSFDPVDVPSSWPTSGRTGLGDEVEPNVADRVLAITCVPTVGTLTVGVTGLPAGGALGLMGSAAGTAQSRSVTQNGDVQWARFAGDYSLTIAAQPGLVDPNSYASYTICRFSSGGTTAIGSVAAGASIERTVVCAPATCPPEVCSTEGDLHLQVTGLPDGAHVDIASQIAGESGTLMITQNSTRSLGTFEGNYSLQVTTEPGIYAVSGGTAHIACSFPGNATTASGSIGQGDDVTLTLSCVANMCPHALCGGDLSVDVTGLPAGAQLSFNTNLAGQAGTLTVMQSGESAVGTFAGAYQLDLTTTPGVYDVTGGQAYIACSFAGNATTVSGTLESGATASVPVSCTSTMCPSVMCPAELELNVSGLPTGASLSFYTNLAGSMDTRTVMQSGVTSLGTFGGSYELGINTQAGVYTVGDNQYFIDCNFTDGGGGYSSGSVTGTKVTVGVTCTANQCPHASCTPACTSDGQCTSGNCYCGSSSGSCSGDSGVCAAAKAVFALPVTDAATPSGTFTVPAQCSQVQIQAWGAAGGPGGVFDSFSFQVTLTDGGAGGFVGGVVDVAEGDQISVWVGQGGELGGTFSGAGGTAGLGSYLGTAASGGAGDGTATVSAGGGSGGGLTSVQIGGSSPRAFVVPGGGGGGRSYPGSAAGVAGSGTEAGSPGGNADASSEGGGGGAGEIGGAGATFYSYGGLGGSYSSLPTGLSSQDGFDATPANTDVNDYFNLCFNGSMSSGVISPASGAASSSGTQYGGDGCVVIRCAGGQ